MSTLKDYIVILQAEKLFDVEVRAQSFCIDTHNNLVLFLTTEPNPKRIFANGYWRSIKEVISL